MTLYLNCCVRAESRTDRLARAVLDKMGGYTERYLPSLPLRPLTRDMLARRTALQAAGQLHDPMFDLAHEFAQADRIVIAAPFWDGSFPSVLKVYIENIYAIGIVTDYRPDGTPYGMCRAEELVYVTTAGGKYVPDFSYAYIQALVTRYFGIPQTRLVMAEMLDIPGYDAEQILRDTIAAL